MDFSVGDRVWYYPLGGSKIKQHAFPATVCELIRNKQYSVEIDGDNGLKVVHQDQLVLLNDEWGNVVMTTMK